MKITKPFLAAVTLAAIYGMNRMSLKEFILAGWGVFRAVTTPAGAVDEATVAARLKACEQCPIFYLPLRTCGSPLADDPAPGCSCHMPMKATLPEASCWADDNLRENNEFGWKHAGVE